jgi:fructokinase
LRRHLRHSRSSCVATADASALAVGELLWDCLPSGLFLGGAPANVACHLQQLGIKTRLVTRVGGDVLGDEAALRLRRLGIDTSLVQYDDERPTGLVRVTLSDDGQPSYDILPAAWDAIVLTEKALEAAALSSFVVYGSLAQRHSTTRNSVRALVRSAVRAVFDVNLRPPYSCKETVLESLEPVPWLVKINIDEAIQLCSWLAMPVLSEDISLIAAQLGFRLSCNVVVTSGGEGAALTLSTGQTFRHRGCKVNVADAVGAGDAFLATLLQGLCCSGQSAAEVLARACAVGAFVASQSGATPTLDWDAIAELQASAPAAEDMTLALP